MRLRRFLGSVGLPLNFTVRRRGLGHHLVEAHRLLQFTGLDVLLVRRLADCLGVTQPCRFVLASAQAGLGEHNSPGRGYRLCCELEEESNFSLRHYSTDPADSRYGALALRHGNRQCAAADRLGTCWRGNLRRVSAGMEIRIGRSVAV